MEVWLTENYYVGTLYRCLNLTEDFTVALLNTEVERCCFLPFSLR